MPNEHANDQAQNPTASDALSDTAAPTHHESAKQPKEAGIIALLGMLAYGELVSFFTVVADADRAPSSAQKVELTKVALKEFEHYELVAARLAEMGADVHEEMQPFRNHLDEWHQRTTPSDWYEGLMKVYAGASIATDFYKECGNFVDPKTQELVDQVLADATHYDFAKKALEEAIADDPRLGARMALWGRRIVGEALSQAQRAAAENDDLTDLLVDSGSGEGYDLAELMRMFARITEAHTARMDALGLSA